MKYFTILAVCLALSGCGNVSKITANLTGYSKICVDNVTYLQFPSGVVIQLNTEGKIVSC